MAAHTLFFSADTLCAAQTLITLARNESLGPLSAQQLHTLSGVARPHIDAIVSLCVDAGLVTLHGHAGGSYTLACHPDDITLGHLVKLMDEDMPSLPPQANPNPPDPDVCRAARLMLEKALESISLRDIMRMA